MDIDLENYLRSVASLPKEQAADSESTDDETDRVDELNGITDSANKEE